MLPHQNLCFELVKRIFKMLQKIQFIAEKVPIRIDVNVISAFSDRWIHHKIVASFLNRKILKLIVLLVVPGERKKKKDIMSLQKMIYCGSK